MYYFDIHTHSISLFSEKECVSFDINRELPHSDVLYVSVGIHPWTLTCENAERSFLQLYDLTKDNKVIAIGEVGLDKLRGPSLDVQISVLRKVIELAEDKRLPLVIHCVRAFHELLALKKEFRPIQPWIIHGFRGKRTVAHELIKHGFYLSVGSQFQEQALLEIPLNRLFIETDDSYESIEEVYIRIAASRNISLEELTEAVKLNVQKVFFKH